MPGPSQVYEEEARAAEKLDAKLAIELRWLERGVTARRRRNQGRLAKLQEMRAQRAAMLGGRGDGEAGAGQGRRALEDGDRRGEGDQELWRAADHPRLHAAHPARRPDRHRRPQRRGQVDVAQAADRRDRARQRQRHPRQDAVGDRHRPAAQADGPGQAGARRARQRRRLDRRPRLQAAHQGLFEGIPVRPRHHRGADRLAVGRRAVAAAARPRIRARGQSAGARRADQRPRPGDARPAAGGDRRLRGDGADGQPRPRLPRPHGDGHARARRVGQGGYRRRRL